MNAKSLFSDIRVVIALSVALPVAPLFSQS